MPDQNSDQQLKILSAKVTALTMLMEALYVGELNRAPNPTGMAESIIQSVLSSENKVRSNSGNQEYVLLVSETITSLIDRALARVLRLQEPPA